MQVRSSWLFLFFCVSQCYKPQTQRCAPMISNGCSPGPLGSCISLPFLVTAGTSGTWVTGESFVTFIPKEEVLSVARHHVAG